MQVGRDVVVSPNPIGVIIYATNMRPALVRRNGMGQAAFDERVRLEKARYEEQRQLAARRFGELSEEARS